MIIKYISFLFIVYFCIMQGSDFFLSPLEKADSRSQYFITEIYKPLILSIATASIGITPAYLFSKQYPNLKKLTQKKLILFNTLALFTIVNRDYWKEYHKLATTANINDFTIKNKRSLSLFNNYFNINRLELLEYRLQKTRYSFMCERDEIKDEMIKIAENIETLHNNTLVEQDILAFNVIKDAINNKIEVFVAVMSIRLNFIRSLHIDNSSIPLIINQWQIFLNQWRDILKVYNELKTMVEHWKQCYEKMQQGILSMRGDRFLFRVPEEITNLISSTLQEGEDMIKNFENNKPPVMNVPGNLYYYRLRYVSRREPRFYWYQLAAAAIGISSFIVAIHNASAIRTSVIAAIDNSWPLFVPA